MNKKYFRYIFMTIFAICILFGFTLSVNAKTVEINITRDSNDEVYWTRLSGVYTINFNSAEKYGGKTEAKIACDNVCALSCSTMGGGAYGCKTTSLKPSVKVEIGDNYPIKLTYDDTTLNSDTKIVTKDCFMTTYIGSSKKEIWGCKTKEECINGCAGACIQRTIKATDAEGKVTKGSAFFCRNNDVKSNLFVDVNGQLMAWDAVHKTEAEAISTVGEASSFFDEWSDIPAWISNVSSIGEGKLNCDDEGLQELIAFMQKIFTFIKIGAPILLIVFTALDFMKAVASSDEGELKKASKKFITRAVVTVAIIILPSVINLVIGIITIGGGTCGIS